MDRLTRIFSSLLAPLAVGCGDHIDEDQFDERLCEQGSPVYLDAVEPAEAVDYLELRYAENFGVPEEPNWNVSIEESSGTLCGGATDAAACMAAYEALPNASDFSVPSFDIGTGFRSLAYTRVDEVGSVGTRTRLVDFLGEVDAIGEAGLLATLGSNHRINCEAPNQVGESGDGYVVYTRTGGGCGEGDDIEGHVVLVHADGTVEIVQTELIEKGEPGCSIGRLPAGLCRRVRVRRRDPVAGFFAEVAQLEAAAVPAFEQLAGELRRHGAPQALVRGAMRSRAEEVRHARVMARVARAYGGRPMVPRVGSVAPRGLLEVARDNAAEGCIRETYGALVAHVQARRARDPRVRRVLAGIARDETRHAALSWSLDGWARARMGATERRRLDRAQADAWARMEVELTAELDPRVHAEAGMPEPDRARAMFDGLRAALRG
ncbi:MAG: ferritin-like domain-containing protein [Myxococcales bacterium]|nr:ferritin-like domain-containing protein [Myxococcales bacterium]MCB9716139.1 ferritin-like domain-containing protein [Myxococcales bacterium]